MLVMAIPIAVNATVGFSLTVVLLPRVRGQTTLSQRKRPNQLEAIFIEAAKSLGYC